MKKLLILPMLLAVCTADFGAVAGPARGRTNANAGKTAGAPAAGAPVKAARAAKQQAPVKQGAGGQKTSGGTSNATTGGQKNTNAGKQPAGKANGARAAATQKAINMGTKVATATKNTVVSEECQNAYYGCMDSFCMLDNAAGGRCQCNDEITELDNILAEIMKLDEQSLRYAQEGVEKVQMGELADEINSRVKSIEKEYMTKEEQAKAQANSKKKKQLDLSAWNNNSMFADDSAFDEEEKTEDFVIEDALANKKGDELHKSVAKICTQQLPTECKANASMLQMAYSQKIRSDCTGYRNSLKQQRTASVQKLQAAQRAVREALLEDEQNKNKYEDLGSCVVAFKQCMQTTGECGTDFSGCVADTSILSALYGKGKGGSKSSKVATTQIKTGASTITISSATYDILQNKAQRCESVVRQCQNANGGKTVAGGKVLGEFMKDVAITVYNTEYNMASNSRMNCITTIINCVKKSCKSAGMDEGTDNYDSCLSNPDSIKNYCALEIKRCGDENSEKDVIAWVQAKLAADRVDRCTEQIKECLTSEDRCGEDYAGCIGLSTDRIVALCPFDKLIACQTKYNKDTVQDYIAEVAQGIALNINNSYGEICEDAAKKSMEEVCGDTTTCETASLSDNLFVNDILTVQMCKTGTTDCSLDAYHFNKDDLIKGDIAPRVVGRLDLSVVGYKDFSSTPIASAADENATPVPEKIFMHDPLTNVDKTAGYKEEDLEKFEIAMQNAFNLKIKQIQADKTVNACLVGKDFQGISKTDGTAPSDSGNGARFPNLLDSYKVVIAQQLVDQLWEIYTNRINTLKQDQWDEVQKKIDARIDELVQFEADKQHRFNEKMCEARKESPNFATGCTSRGRRGITYGTTVSYDSSTSTCSVTRKSYTCKKRIAGCCWSWQNEDEAKVVGTDSIPMKKVNRGTLADGIKTNTYDSDDNK